MWSEVRARRREGGGGREEAQAACKEGPDSRLGIMTRAERTRNIWPIYVTREVSQLDMSALKFPWEKKSCFMLVMAETFQPAMAPYFSIAVVGLSL